MSSTKNVRSLAIAICLGLSMVVAACGGSDETAKKDNGATANAGAAGNAKTGQSSPDGGKEGRAFDSSDGTVKKAITIATKAKDVEFDGSEVRVIFDKGSTEDATAWLPCTGVKAVLADDESAFLVYPDGELDCSQRPGY